MVRRLALGAVMAIGMMPVPAGAQDLCHSQETLSVCINRLHDELFAVRAEAAETAKTGQQLQAKKTETGLDDITGLSSSVKDFLPVLQASGVIGAVQKDDKSGLVTVALSTPFLGSSGTAKKDNSLQIKAVIDTTAKLFAPLKKLLPEDDRDALEKKLLGRKADAENVSLNASYNVSSRRWGRNFNQHKDTLDALFAHAIAAANDPRDTYMERAAKLTEGVEIDPNVTRWKDLPAAAQSVLEDRLNGIVEAEQRLAKAVTAALKESGLDLYVQLVTNQPQLLVSLSQTFRDDLFGPDLLSGRLSFEIGLGNNLNAALGALNGTCAWDTTSADKCLKAYSQFAKNASTRAAVKGGSRLAVFVEFVKNDAYHFTSTDPRLDLAIAEGTGWSAGLDYGRLIAVDDDGQAGGRIDGSIKWEAPADTSVDRRFVASLTLTKKIGDVSVPFGIVYANKPQFLTGVDHGLSANLGLKFNLFSGLR